jgi:tetratricopeptide (TPR) repeat protein
MTTEQETERAFLLRSLDDLEVEHAAGDLSDDDLVTMRADYQSRLADVQRRIEGDASQRARDAELAIRAARSQRRSWVFGVAATVFALGCGFFVAGSLGERKAGETITGDVPQDPLAQKTSELMQRAQELSSTDPVRSIEAYDQVRKLNPDVVSAWAYGGWQLRLFAIGAQDPAARTELLEGAKRRIDEAIRRDPTYADAYAFRAVMAARDFGDDDAARAALKTLETLDRNPLIDQLTGPLRSDLGM